MFPIATKMVTISSRAHTNHKEQYSAHLTVMALFNESLEWRLSEGIDKSLS